GNYLIWVKWLQSDDQPREAVVYEQNRELVRFMLPVGQPIPMSELHCARQEIIVLSTQPPYDGGTGRHPDTAILKVPRDRKLSGLTLWLGMPGSDQGPAAQTMQVVDVPALDSGDQGATGNE